MHRSGSRCERRGRKDPVPRAGAEGQCLGWAEPEPETMRRVAVTGQAGGRDSEVLELLEVPAGQGPSEAGNAHMTTMEPAPRQVAVKVSPEGNRLITSGAHYLRMSKKDLVEAAVVFYLNARREEMQAGMRELLSQLDGSRAARVALLAGMTREELEAAGGAGEDG
jgi:hypothetical protein